MFTYYIVMADPERYAISTDKADVLNLSKRWHVMVHSVDAPDADSALEYVFQQHAEFECADKEFGWVL